MTAHAFRAMARTMLGQRRRKPTTGEALHLWLVWTPVCTICDNRIVLTSNVSIFCP